jgi:hypothetical protein
LSVSRRAAADAEARLADDFLDGYVYWREACDAVRAAYERWRGGQRPDRPAAFAVYQAALDQEERAALAFGERTAQMSESVDQEPW